MLAIVCLSFSTSLEPPATVADVQGAGSGGGLPPTIPCTQMTSVQLIGTLAFVRFS